MNEKIEALIKKGVRFPNPETVEIGPEVDIRRIAGEGVVIHGGSRIGGEATCISEKAVLGEEAPVTVMDCQLGPGVRLKGGFFNKAVFLRGASMGSGAHVREGTILEEESSGAHAVGLKQTILFPFVTLGSLINFCDCFMAGGTSRKDHSEVGSSYIHFNFTPYQDKATPSLLGDVPHGVMLNQKPIFLGGQGGLVGPCRLAFGTVVAAGSICRKDELRSNRLLYVGSSRTFNVEFSSERFLQSGRILANNIAYIANLLALSRWYREVRVLFVQDSYSKALHAGLLQQAEAALTERVLRLGAYFTKTSKKGGASRWASFEEAVQELRSFSGEPRRRDLFLEGIEASRTRQITEYVAVIKGLGHEARTEGTAWLEGIVEAAARRMSDCLLHP